MNDGAAGAHGARKLGLRHPSADHGSLDLCGEELFLRQKVDLFALTKLIEQRAQGRPAVLLLHDDLPSFFRRRARSRSACGVLRLFFWKPCKRIMVVRSRQKITL